MIKKKNKFFEIIKYNKKLQNRFNFNINTYKDYSQLYTPIEIELKPADNLNLLIYLKKKKIIFIFILMILTKK